MVRLALPVVLAEVGWTTMGMVDLLMVGTLGPAAIGAVGVGSILLITVGVFGMGLLLGLDTLVAQAYGAGAVERCHHWLLQGVYLGLLVSIPQALIAYGVIRTLPVWGLTAEVETATGPYLGIVSLSLPVLMVYSAFRRYLQAMDSVKVITFALLSANLVNIAANWVLIHGRFGAPELGVNGAAWATVLSRLYMAAVLGGAVYCRDRRHATNLLQVKPAISWASQKQLVGLGLPAAVQITLEVGVFAVATALAGRLSVAALAAHQVALHLWSIAFMVPLGLNAAGAVRVGQAVGRQDPAGVRRSGSTALALGAVFTASFAALFLLSGEWLISRFSADPAVLQIGTSLLAIAGLCLVFDGTQGVATGILRGLGETRIPMLTSLAGHWGVGLPLAYLACFPMGWGVQGLWVGLAVGLVLIGIVLLLVWSRRVRPETSPLLRKQWERN